MEGTIFTWLRKGIQIVKTTSTIDSLVTSIVISKKYGSTMITKVYMVHYIYYPRYYISSKSFLT